MTDAWEGKRESRRGILSIRETSFAKKKVKVQEKTDNRLKGITSHEGEKPLGGKKSEEWKYGRERKKCGVYLTKKKSSVWRKVVGTKSSRGKKNCATM